MTSGVMGALEPDDAVYKSCGAECLPDCDVVSYGNVDTTAELLPVEVACEDVEQRVNIFLVRGTLGEQSLDF